MNSRVVLKILTTIITVAIMYCLIGTYKEELTVGISTFSSYIALASLGGLLGFIFGHACYKLFAKNSFLTSIISTIIVVLSSLEAGLFVSIPMADLCIAITFLIVSCDIADMKNKLSEKPR
ncbi:hypothetical protein D5018_20590 [Parashewanella curva]|uniref:Uncharacterized protein n=1 Tax=Parashewanella curva TaxID=2338552 RepID=A0A3L8PQZ3_9GAMM|nr:hypothetical protein [Parashewanella curva]RLV57807.1 hypothetical protein D5018_20590 [Parashewanella curva]